MPNRAKSRLFLAAACVLLAAGVVFTWIGLRRLQAARDAGQNRELFVFEPVTDRTFRFAGRPVSIEDRKDERSETVVVRNGDAELVLNPPVPSGPEQLPGLLRHEDWMQVLRFAPRRGLSIGELQQKIDAGEIADRLAIVIRSPRPGADPATWGQVWRKDWVFDFYEFQPAGEITHERLKYPTNRSGEPAGPDELVEGTWQFDAALMVMPKGSVPKAQFREDGWKAMGLTLPAAMVAFLASMGFVIAAFSGRREAVSR
jgi:hypothetical protein